MGVPGSTAHKSHGGDEVSQVDRIGIVPCSGHSVGESPVTDTCVKVMFGIFSERKSGD